MFNAIIITCATAAWLAADGEVPAGAAGGAAAAPPSLAPRGRDEARAAAQAALAEGNRRFKAQDFAGARAEYRKAMALYPDSAGKVQFNLAKVEEALGNEDAAAEAFSRFLELPDDLVTTLADFRAEAAAALQRLSPNLGGVTVQAPRDGLLLLVDGRDRGTTPLSTAVRLRPGRHVLSLQHADRIVFRKEIEVSAGDTVRLDVAQLEASADPPVLHAGGAVAAAGGAAEIGAGAAGADLTPSRGPDDGAERPVWKKWWFWTATGTALVVGVAAVLLTTRSENPCPTTFSCTHAPMQ